MFKRGYIILFLLCTSILSSQEKGNYAQVAKQFVIHFNNEAYDSIFQMFDTQMKKALPLDKTKAFFKYNVAPAGKIKTMTFSKLKSTAHIYKTTFEKAVLDILISLDAKNKINGFYASIHVPDNLPKLERNTTKMILPFKGEWDVFWGGTSVDQNYHVAYINQKYAYDIVIRKDNKSFKTDGESNEDYYAFGKEIIAPCDGEIVKVITGVEDNIPGVMNPKQVTGNTIVLKTVNNEYILMAHFKAKSIVVKQGQKVKQGDLIGQCGNSGNSSEAHLHLSLQNVKDMMIATGGKLYFEKIKVNGEIKTDYLPVKNDKIQNIKR